MFNVHSRISRAKQLGWGPGEGGSSVWLLICLLIVPSETITIFFFGRLFLGDMFCFSL